MTKKIRDFLWHVRNVAKSLPFMPLALIMRLIRPIVWFRFREIFASRLGHLAGTIDVYVCQRDAAVPKGRVIELIYWFDEPCNKFLAQMWERTQPIFPLARHIDRANKLLPGQNKHSVPFHGGNDRSGALNNAREIVSLTEQEIAQGEARLAEIVPGPVTRLACVFNRDAEYLIQSDPGMDYSYHDYRNSSIESYRTAVTYLLDEGYTVFRMGEFVAEKLDIDHPNYVEFTDFYDDFMDVFLFHRCDLQMGAGSGIICLGRMFRKPTAMVNAAPMFTTSHYRTRPEEVFIPKLYWSETEGRYLKTSEIRDMGAGFFDRSEQYREIGITMPENNPDDILAITREIVGLSEGNYQLTAEDRDLQRAFWNQALPGTDCSEYFQISPAFVRNNPFVIE